MRTEIPLSKTKITLSIAGCIVFILLGYMLITDDYELYNTTFTKAVGIVSIVFFGVILLFAFYKLFDKKPGLVIDDSGILDNSSGISAGLIEWQDITRIEVKTVISTKFLIIHVSNSEKYIKRVPAQKAWLMRRNMGLYGSPLSISSTALKYNFEDLYRIVKVNLEKHNGNRIAEAL